MFGPITIDKRPKPIQRMKNLYLSIPIVAMALASGTGALAQTAKPRPAKATRTHQTMIPVRTTPSAAAEYRGGLNDECATAISVDVATECAGSVATYDAEAATQSLDPILCNGFTSPEANDLWFSFVATSAVTSVQVEGTMTFDAVIEGFTGSCGDLQSVGCADANFPDPDVPENMTETLNMATTAGTTYFVRVYSYWSPAPTDFTFTLCVFAAPDGPANDLCTGTTPVSIATGSSATFTGDNTDALDTEGLGLPSVWHSFTISECADVTLDYCGTPSVFANALLSLFTSCPTVAGEFIGATSFDVTTCTDGNVTIFYNGVPPGTYYYPVIRDDAAPAVGEYTVNVAVSEPVSYCAAALEACDETIGRVTVGSIDNTSDCAAGDVVDYTDQSTDIIQTEIVPITVENGGTPYAVNTVSVWVDWNQDQSFCNANELHILSSADEGVTFTGNIIAPPDAIPGATRMRVRMAYNAAPRPCGTVQYGEIEDYTVNVILGNGINETTAKGWSVFPNPSNGDMMIDYAGEDAKVTIELFDVAGRNVYQEQRQLANGQRTGLGLAGTLAHGSYTLRLSTADGRSEQRVVVQ